MDTLLALLDAMNIASWEAVFFVLLVSAYMLMGLTRSCLIIAFGFTFYWGFKNFLYLTDGLSQKSLTLYVICGLVLIGLVSLNYVLREFKRA